MHLRSFVLLACVAACSPSADQDERAAGGIEVVESPAALWRAGEGWRVGPEPTVRIGETEGAAAYLLTNVVGAGRLRDGTIVIANGGTQEIRYFHENGTHRATAGGKGDGPGEFRWIDWMGAANDSVFVWDSFARLLSVLDAAGRFVRSVTFDGLDLPFPQAIGLMDGSLVLRPRPDPEANGARAGERVDSVAYLPHSIRDGSGSGRLGPFLDAERFVARVGGLHMSAPVLFGRQGMIAVHPRGFYVVESERFAARLHAPGGRPVREVRRAHEAVRASRADVAARRAEMGRERDEIVTTFPNMAPVRARLMEQLPYRETLPAVSAAIVDSEDRLWMRAYSPPRAAVAEWSVFEADGRWLGIVTLPAALRVLAIGEGWVLGTHADEDDGVERVVLHALERGG
jgi:hypothetical protein